MRTFLCMLLISTAQCAFAADYEGEARKFITDDVFKCPSTGLTFHAPDLKAETLEVNYRETTPGITWSLMFAEEMGHIASVKYTKIRAEYPKTDAILHRTAANIKGIALQQRGYVEWCGFLSDEKGQVLQCIIRHPAAGQTVSVRNVWLKSMQSVRTDVYAIRHYLVRDGYFLEFNVYVPQLLPTGSYDEDKYIDAWATTLHKFVMGCVLVQAEDTYADQLKKFNRPKSYFRFVFADPSRG